VPAEFAYSNSVQASTCFTPFYLTNGQHPHTPLSLALEHSRPPTEPPAAHDFSHRFDENLSRAKHALSMAQQRQQRNENQKRHSRLCHFISDIMDYFLAGEMGSRLSTGSGLKLTGGHNRLSCPLSADKALKPYLTFWLAKTSNKPISLTTWLVDNPSSRNLHADVFIEASICRLVS